MVLDPDTVKVTLGPKGRKRHLDESFGSNYPLKMVRHKRVK